MNFHHSSLGRFGAHLPCDGQGYVTCSPARVRACMRAHYDGREAPEWADTGCNREVAEAEIAAAAWNSAGKTSHAGRWV